MQLREHVSSHPGNKIHSLHQDVVVGDQEHIDARFKGGAGQVSVEAGTIRIGGMHMQIDNQFVHGVG